MSDLPEDDNYRLAVETRKRLGKERELYVAQWIIQNPQENIKDYSLVIYDDYNYKLKRYIRSYSLEKRNE